MTRNDGTSWMRATGWGLLGLLSLAACGGGGGEPCEGASCDADGGAGDAGADGGGGGPSLPEATVGGSTRADDPFGQRGGTAADYACLGMSTVPDEAGTPGEFTLVVQDFETGDPVPDLCLAFYADNQVPASDECTDTSPRTDDMGRVSVSDVEGSWYAYRVFPKEGTTPANTYVGSIQVNEPAPADGGRTEASAIALSTVNLIPTALGLTRAPGTALVAGRVVDCGDENVHGVIVRVYEADGTPVPEGAASDPEAVHYRFFDGSGALPSAEQPYTHVDGLYGVLNLPVPASGGEFFIEAWGRRAGDAEPVLLACERIRAFPDVVNIVNLTPLRADAPACPGLGG